MKKTLSEMGEHIVNGIKYTIPLIVVYSVFSAIAGAGYINVGSFNANDYIFIVLVPILTAFISHSISPKISFVPGLVLGYFIATWGLGYIGGIIGGLFLGYLLRCIASKIKLDNEILCFIIGYFVLGAFGFVVSYYVVYYMAKPGILEMLGAVNILLGSISSSQTVLLVIVLAGLTVFDLGGPFNKIAYGFIIQFYTEGLFHITGPVLVSVMLPPLGVFLGLVFLKDRFSKSDQNSKKLALFGAIFGLTEGALVVGYRRPLKIIPILMIGSISGSALASMLGLENSSLLVSVPSLVTVNNIGILLLSTTVGALIILGLFFIVLPKEKVEVA